MATAPGQSPMTGSMSNPASHWIPPGPTPQPATPTSRPEAEPRRLYHVPILMYHRIIPTSEAGDSRPDLVVAPATFSAQLKALFDAGWHSITMAELADDMEADRPVATKTFVITIDDGWSDGYDYAFPIMRKYGYVGTFFMVAGRIDHRASLTTQEMRTLEAAGNEIGNHTEHHVSLSKVLLSHVEHEVEDASRQIARAVGHRPVSLAYPMGGVSNPVVTVVSQIPDIKIAVTTQRGKTETWLGRYEVPRVPVRPDTDPARLLASLSS